MYNRKQLEKHGVTPEKIKPKAEALDVNKEGDKFSEWIDREAARIRSGVDLNLKNWRLWHALDQAYDAPFHQISYTLLKDIISKDYDDEQVKSLVEDFGVGHLLEPVLNNNGEQEANADGSPKMAINVPTFFEIFVPLCAAYVKARWAKLFNDRNLTPLYKYEPAYSTPDNRLRCDILTFRMSVMANQYGYANDEKDSMFQSLHYGISIAFPREAWHREFQLDDEGEERVEREGLRFNMPPPERMYYDQSERLSTLNSNSGVAFAGYWHIAKLGDVKASDWWNKDKIAYGLDVDIISASPNFFSNIYPCALKFPTAATEENDREVSYAAYATAEDDTAVLLTEHFTTVVPADVGIGTYKYPVTFRMVMMNYDTVAYIEPIYCAMGAYYGYDADGNRAKNSSLTLEIMPFQDQIGNILTQWICSARQNLISPTFYDRTIIPKEAMDQIKNNGEKVIRGRTFIDFSSREMAAKIGETREAFYSPTFPMLPTGEMRMLISGMLDLLERALGFSPQEIGQAASHEQSATETNIINSNVGNRVQFTGSFVDDGIWAKKKMLYDAFMANADDDITAEVYPNYTEDEAAFKTLCKKLGIEVQDRAGNNGERARVKVPKDKIKVLHVEAFVANRDAEKRINTEGVATAAVQLLTGISSNPELFAAMGPEQVIELVNQIASLLQLPKDFRIRFNAKSMKALKEGQQMPPDLMQQIQEGMKQMAEEIGKRIQQGEQELMQAMQEGDQKVAEGVAKEVGPALQQQGEAIQQQGEAIAKVAQREQQVEKALQDVGAAIKQISEALKATQEAQAQTMEAMQGGMMPTTTTV